MRRIQFRKAFIKLLLFLTLISLIVAVFLMGAVVYRKLGERITELVENSKVLNADYLYGKYDIILNSYMNSGSTFTGRILGFRPDAFYFYEPLWHLTESSYYRDNATMCSSRAPICKKIAKDDMNRNQPIPGRPLDFKLLHDQDIRNFSVPRQIPQRILDLVFSCKLRKLRNVVQPGVTAEVGFSGPSWNEYRFCMQRRKPIETCLAVMETICSKALHRVSKVLRLTLGAMETLLTTFPKLKVVHLFRDPRAIINSRIETRGYPLTSGSSDIRINAKVLCDKMAVDLNEGRALLRKFPDRFRFIHYEDIYGNEDALINLHTYLGMSVSRGDLIRAKMKNTNSPQRKNEAREQERKYNNGFWWTKYMAFSSVQVVNRFCERICTELGYPIIKNEGELRNLNINKTLKHLKYVL